MTQFISQLKAERALSGSLPGDLDLNDHILNDRNKDHTVQYLSFRFQSMLLLVRFSHVLQSKSCSELYLETRCITWRLSQDVSTLYWYGVFSHDVTAAILVSQNNETAAMLVSQTSPVEVQLFSYVCYVNAFFCSNKFAYRRWPRE